MVPQTFFPSLHPKTEWSESREHRYWWEKSWSAGKDRVNFLMLNPSIADEQNIDPTVKKCCKFSKVWGFSGIIVTNIFALVSTDPRSLYTHPDPVGPKNNTAISEAASRAEIVVAAWGTHGRFNDRAAYVRDCLLSEYDLFALDVNQDGSPKHPLYVSYAEVEGCCKLPRMPVRYR